MSYDILYAEKHTVYPGEYVPMPETEALLGQVRTPHKEAAKLMINMDELSDCFKIEMALPGIGRENIFLHVFDNLLTVTIIHKSNNAFKKKLKMREFETGCLTRHIVLPVNTDPEFASAEYGQGVLSLHIPKTDNPLKSANNHIVVY
jgi:HSP20 family molecular chaperone IbpA